MREIANSGPVRVMVADNTRIHTQLLSEALRRDHGLQVITADSDSHSLAAAATERSVDVLAISSSLDEQAGRGFEVLRELRSLGSRVRTVILLDSSKAESVLEAFRAGARGVFSRQESLDTLARCIHCVHEGQIWANSQQMSLAVEALAAAPTVRAVDAKGLRLLSKRELEVVRCLSEGMTNREIADRLQLSQHTIKNYLFRVFDKLGVSSRIELLFMTLSQDTRSQSLFEYFRQEGNEQTDASTIAACEDAAENGDPTAQLSLSKMLWERQESSEDLVRAYTWHLLAQERLTRERKTMNQAMTPQQVVEAEQKAAAWLNRSRKNPSPAFTKPPRAISVGATASAD